MLGTQTQSRSFISNAPTGQPTRIRQSPDGLPARATRYGGIPIQPITGLPPTSIRMGELPPNKFVAFEVFEFPTTDMSGSPVMREVEPSGQIADMHTASGERTFTEFPEMAKLGDPMAAAALFEGVLTNPNPCEKYGNQIGNQCATCWLTYLDSQEFSERVAQEVSPNLIQVVIDTANRWRTGLIAALGVAQRDYQNALEEVENPKSGKNVFYDYDYINMWHLHENAPKFRITQSPNEGIGKEIGEVLAQYLPRISDAPSTVDPEVLNKLMAMVSQQASEIATLRALVKGGVNTPDDEKSEKQTAETLPSIAVGTEVVADGAVGEVMSNSFGRYKVRFPDLTTKTFTRNEIDVKK